MEAFKIKLFVVVAVLLVAISSNGVLQISNAQTICNVSVSGLMACKSAVTPPNPTTPSTDCCTALSHADLRCLCSYRNSNLLPSLGIDPNLPCSSLESANFLTLLIAKLSYELAKS
ncbi:hypothetical protein ACB092_M005200 [Castanea dentata]